MKFARTLISLAGATILLGALVASASAGRISASSQTIRATFARINFSGGFGTTECPLTIEGSFHSRTIAKVAGALTGVITRVGTSTCQRGSVTLLAETLPWHVSYSGFAGTLPNITALTANVINVSFQIREPVFGVTCLIRSEVAQPEIITFDREAGGVVNTVRAGGTIGSSCGVSGTFSGSSTTFTALSNTNRITVTLI